jgi:hypothetical protein
MTTERAVSSKSAKEEALEVVERLPSDASMDDILYALDVMRAIRQGEDDVAAGNVLTQDEVEERVRQWRASSGQRARPPASE